MANNIEIDSQFPDDDKVTLVMDKKKHSYVTMLQTLQTLGVTLHVEHRNYRWNDAVGLFVPNDMEHMDRVDIKREMQLDPMIYSLCRGVDGYNYNPQAIDRYHNGPLRVSDACRDQVEKWKKEAESLNLWWGIPVPDTKSGAGTSRVAAKNMDVSEDPTESEEDPIESEEDPTESDDGFIDSGDEDPTDSDEEFMYSDDEDLTESESDEELTHSEDMTELDGEDPSESEEDLIVNPAQEIIEIPTIAEDPVEIPTDGSDSVDMQLVAAERECIAAENERIAVQARAAMAKRRFEELVATKKQQKKKNLEKQLVTLRDQKAALDAREEQSKARKTELEMLLEKHVREITELQNEKSVVLAEMNDLQAQLDALNDE